MLVPLAALWIAALSIVGVIPSLRLSVCGVLVCWCVGVLVCWCVGIMVRWCVGVGVVVGLFVGVGT
jgi:hypothetical protein